ncbi:hypothetical protein PV326_014173 [Microctonus aethiopoides]|nr:hypothetical protein PV326_014173 [Microctonus aethiopoides]
MGRPSAPHVCAFHRKPLDIRPVDSGRESTINSPTIAVWMSPGAWPLGNRDFDVGCVPLPRHIKHVGSKEINSTVVKKKFKGMFMSLVHGQECLGILCGIQDG